MHEGEKLYLHALPEPITTTDVISWVSGDPDVASVRNGVVTAHKAGLVAIMCETTSGQKASCTITITDDEGIKSTPDETPAKDIRKAYLESKISDKAYTGKAVTPEIDLMLNQFTRLTPGLDYTLSYRNNKNIGTATVVINGAGHYTGSMTKTFNIVPPKTKGLKLKTRTAKSMTLTWKKTKGASGYVLEQYNAKTKKWTAIKTLKSEKKPGCKVIKMKPNTRYKFRVRAFKKVGKKTYYGKYSSTLSKTTARKK